MTDDMFGPSPMHIKYLSYVQANLDMTDSMEPGKLVRHMQNLSYTCTYDKYLDWDQAYCPSYAKICRTVFRHIQVHLYMTDFAYEGPIFLVPLSLSYPSSPVPSTVNSTIKIPYHVIGTNTVPFRFVLRGIQFLS